MTGSALQAMDVVVRLSEAFLEESDERRYMSGSRLARPWRMTGRAFSAMDVMLMKRSASRGEVQRGDTPRGLHLSEAGGLLPNGIYTHKLNFLGSLFWIGFGEVLERSWREILESKCCKNTVFYNGV